MAGNVASLVSPGRDPIKIEQVSRLPTYRLIIRNTLVSRSLRLYIPTMDFKPSASVLFGHYSLPRRRILTKLGRTKFEKVN